MAVSHVKSNTIANWTGTVTVGNSTGGTQTIAASALVQPQDWNSAHNQYYSLAGNTTNASTASGTNVVFGATGKAIIAGSTDSVFVSVPNTYLSFYQNVDAFAINNQVNIGGATGMLVVPFLMPQDGSFSYMRFLASINNSTTTFTTGAAGYGSSVAQSNTMWANIYTRGTGTNSQSLQYLTQASTTWVYQISYSGTASTHSVSYNITYPGPSGVSTSTQMTSSAQSSAVNEVPAGTSNFTGQRFWDLPFETSLSAGNYFVGIQRSSTTAGGSNVNFNLLLHVLTQGTQQFAFPGAATNSTLHYAPFLGVWTTNSSGATTSSIARSLISTTSSNFLPIFQFLREA